MTLATIQSYYYRRTKTNSTSFPAADQVIALNNAHNYYLSLMKAQDDNFNPTDWTTTDLSTGTATPLFDATFHELIPLRVTYQFLAENDRNSAQRLFVNELLPMENRFKRFIGGRDNRICTVTIASPGVFTRDDHRLCGDDRIIFTTSGALPTGISANTWYYVIVVDEDSFEVTATEGGTAINTSGTQSGTHWFAVARAPRMTMSYRAFR